MKLYLVYEGDAWLSTGSQALCGVYTSRTSAINSVLRNNTISADEVADKYCGDDWTRREIEAEKRRVLRDQLELWGQTQGFKSNYNIECITANGKEWEE